MVTTIKTVTKWQQLLAILRAALDAGEFKPGQQMPSENELQGTYGVGKSTIREAISGLVQEGRLVRLHGKGTFVREAAPSKLKSCALFLHAYGHLYGAMTQAVVSALQAHNVIPMVFDLQEMADEDKSGVKAAAFLTQVLDRGVDAIVTEGDARWISDCCIQQRRPCPPLALIHQGYGHANPQVRVFTDVRAGTELGTRYLMKLGHRDILFVVHRNGYLPAAAPPESDTGTYGDIIRGYLAAMGKSCPPRILLLEDEFRTEAARARLRRILEAVDRPTAVFAYEDYRAKCVMDIAAGCGLSVPDDLSVLGYFNTPWAEHTAVPLSSISLRETEMAQRVVERLLGDKAAWPVSETVTPVLVERASCAAPCRRAVAMAGK